MEFLRKWEESSIHIKTCLLLCYTGNWQPHLKINPIKWHVVFPGKGYCHELNGGWGYSLPLRDWCGIDPRPNYEAQWKNICCGALLSGTLLHIFITFFLKPYCEVNITILILWIQDSERLAQGLRIIRVRTVMISLISFIAWDLMRA